MLNAVIQKQTLAAAESGVMKNFSFLLFERRFITVLRTRYEAKNIQIILVTPLENQSGIKPPACNIMRIAKT